MLSGGQCGSEFRKVIAVLSVWMREDEVAGFQDCIKGIQQLVEARPKSGASNLALLARKIGWCSFDAPDEILQFGIDGFCDSAQCIDRGLSVPILQQGYKNN